MSNEATRKKFKDEGVSIKKMDSIHFAFEENLTTGYEWIMETPSPCKGLVSTASSYDAPQFENDDIEYVGAPGTRYYSVTGKSKGECTWKIAYARNWEFDWENRQNAAVQMVSIDLSVL